jgi:hypothetical protein
MKNLPEKNHSAAVLSAGCRHVVLNGVRHCFSAVIFTISLLAGCSGSPESRDGIWASGQVAGHPFAARVDSEIARYYLEDFPASHPDGWHDELSDIITRLPDGVVSNDALADIVRSYGSADLAALVFTEKVYALEKNREIAECFATMNRELGDPKIDPHIFFAKDPPELKAIFAPGWLYKSNPETEADFSRTRRSLDSVGMPYQFVPLLEDGTVAYNARLLAEAIRESRDGDRPVIVVSASKSASEVALALGSILMPEETKGVYAWINIGGVIDGTPLADHWTSFPHNLLARLAFLFKGWEYASLVDLRTDRSAERLAGIQLPAHLVVVNYLAVPMGSQVSAGARKRYRLLSRSGPSDGLALLASTAVPEGITIVELGADHYFLTVDISLRALALTRVVQRFLTGQACP